MLRAIFLVLDGQKTWREAGSDAAELYLAVLGVPRAEAQALASGELPSLPPAPSA